MEAFYEDDVEKRQLITLACQEIATLLAIYLSMHLLL